MPPIIFYNHNIEKISNLNKKHQYCQKECNSTAIARTTVTAL